MYIRPNIIDGIPKDAVLVNEVRLFAPDRNILRKKAVPGTGVRLPSRKTPVRPGRNGESN